MTITNVNWNSGVTFGTVTCRICGATFDNHAQLSRHIFEDHGDGVDLVDVDGGDGLELSLFPWEDAQAALADAEAVLGEADTNPYPGPADDVSESDFMAATLAALRLGLVEPVVRLTAAQMREIEDERIGAEFCEQPYAW